VAGYVFQEMGLEPIFCFSGVMGKVLQQLQSLVEGVVEPLGYEFWGVESLARPGAGQLLRVYIESPDGIGVDDCERVSRQLGAVLDVEDPIAGEYVLEVSSPGMDRPLYRLDQFVRHLGDVVRVRLSSVVAGRRNFRGELLAADGEKVQLLVDGETVTLAMDEIDTARVVPQFQARR